MHKNHFTQIHKLNSKVSVPFILLFLCLCFSCEKPQSKLQRLNPATLNAAFETSRESAITHRRFKHRDIQPLIKKHRGAFKVEELGKSVQGRSIQQLEFGEGETKVLLWSQMHGDESTATMALFDLFNFLEAKNDSFNIIRNVIRKNLKIRFIPMLNPDGAEVFTRRNAYGIDLNRDAIKEVSPEASILKAAREAFAPSFGFNLHDQQIYYNVEQTAKPATISVLAPAFNHKTEINDVRANAMQVIVGMNRILQKVIPEQVGKYDDAFEPRAFGDNFQKWGTSTILIESGGYPNDPEKQYIRQLNFMIILNALYEIAHGDYTAYAVEDYFRIPDNDRKLMDLILKNVTIHDGENKYQLDLGIKRQNMEMENGYAVKGQIDDVGDLSVYFGYKELDASGLEYVEGKLAEESIVDISDLDREKALELLKEGFLAIRLKNMPESPFHDLPILVLHEHDSIPSGYNAGSAPNFYLKKNNELLYAVVNGYLINLKKPEATGLKQSIW
ncbi:peptidase M14 [Echinicola marina]|uniref:M14 family metallopeptidase n=1 Tax=Echinicola marina TaxID=2859768 RepID=UPI001CF646BF|nr:M14 metallopeptidase family protein [Echinicola marina]UCS94626.1 peptidase M14 [Echinicola marina]